MMDRLPDEVVLINPNIRIRIFAHGPRSFGEDGGKLAASLNHLMRRRF
jgi:hypothetical protein